MSYPDPNHAIQDPGRDQFLMNERDYDNIRTAKLEITEDQVRIVPAKTAWGCLVTFNVLCLVMAVSFMIPVALYAPDDRRMFGVIIIPLIMFATGAAVTTLTLRRFWGDQAQGAWLILDRRNGVVTLPRQGITVPVDQVDYLQSISGAPLDANPHAGFDAVAELNIAIRTDGVSTRYNLLNYIAVNEFDAMAKEIAKLGVIPVVRVTSRTNPNQVYETWLSPRRTA